MKMTENLKNPSILYSCGSSSWGGLEIITLDLAIKLQEKGINIALICKNRSKIHSEANKNNINTIPILENDLSSFSAILKLKKYLKENNIDIIHTHLSHDLWVLTPALNLAKVNTRLFMTKHMASGIKKKDILHKYLYNRVDRIFAISEYIKESLINTVPINNSKITLLHIGIDTERFNSKRFNIAGLKKELQFPENRLVIGMTGRMTPGKGFEDFINAAKILIRKYPGKLFFSAAGNASYGENKYEQSLKELASDLKKDEFAFIDFTDIPEKYMASLDILVFPSHDESFGRILAEAMSLGVPTAASRFAGVLDITVENETGLLFERKNHLSMAQTLEKMIFNEELRNKFSTTGRKRIMEHFDIEKSISELIYYYKN